MIKSRGDMRQEVVSRTKVKKQRTSDGRSGMALGVARVVTVNYEEHTVTLREVLGSDQEFVRNPVPITYPGAGKRTFVGVMPEEGDYCVIGKIAQETDGRTATPVILAWILPGTWIGHDWLSTQPFAPDEFSMDPKDSSFVAGVYQRVRHKLRHIEPGNFMASSSQGSDIVLNEDFQAMNRRGCEFILRDPDQAAVTRAQQRFDALCGTRLYSGMVQRDATFLPRKMFSDGVAWDGSAQFDARSRTPLTEDDLRFRGTGVIFGALTPHPVLTREIGGQGARPSGVYFDTNLDPYAFLSKGLFLSRSATFNDEKVFSDAVYGGKSYYRVSPAQTDDGSRLNAAVGFGDSANAYTEHRIEVAHTSDGRLPVTEQTDGFDAERLPRNRLDSQDALGQSANAPFLEVVYGTVVGNDPFTLQGRTQYGQPLRPVIFDVSGAPAPAMELATNRPESEQAAMLFRVNPTTVTQDPATFWSVTKDGRFFAAINGPASKEYSAEISIQSGLRLSVGGTLKLEPRQGIELSTPSGDSRNNLGLNLNSDNGAVRIYGGGNLTGGSAAARTAPTGGGESDSPSVLVEGRVNTTVKASRRILLETPNVIENRAGSINQQALSGVQVKAGDSYSVTSTVYNQTTNGKAVYSYHGPKNNLPTSGPTRETTFTGVIPGTVDSYTMVQGNRQELFFAGNHSTQVLVGNLTYETLAGIATMRAGLNEFSANVATGVSATATVGNVSMSAVAGATLISGQVAVTVKSTGPAILSGQAGVTLGGPGKIGGIVCGSDLDPLTGLPLVSLGMGSPGHNLGPAV